MFDSSMGGLIATIAALKAENIATLVLMATGLAIAKRWPDMLSLEEVINWKLSGERKIYHHGYKEDRDLNYGFTEDLENHQTDNLKTNVKTLIFHLVSDEVVPIQVSLDFVGANKNDSTLLHSKTVTT